MSRFPFTFGKFQTQMCPDFHLSNENFKSEQVRISSFQLLNFKSRRVGFSIPDTSRFQFCIRLDFNFLVAKFKIWTSDSHVHSAVVVQQLYCQNHFIKQHIYCQHVKNPKQAPLNSFIKSSFTKLQRWPQVVSVVQVVN